MHVCRSEIRRRQAYKEDTMSFGPHPRALIVITEQRRAEVAAQADQLRLVKLIQPNSGRRQPWSDLPALSAVATALAPLLTALHRG
jgi:hypothetical protein